MRSAMDKDKLAIFDLDGTLFDTRNVNYLAYSKALAHYGFSLDYEYFCSFCNGRHYMSFLPQITTDAKTMLEGMHKLKQECYEEFLDKAVVNQQLFNLIRVMKSEYHIALVTTASEKNCYQILKCFDKVEEFDLILTHDDMQRYKPDPQGFQMAMEHFNADAENTVIFEDSPAGLEAALKVTPNVYRAYMFL